MQTLCKDSKSVYLLEDSDTVNITDSMIEVRGTRDFNIGDMNTSNTTHYTSITAPADWKGGKYSFDGTTWTVVMPDAVPTEVSMRQARLALLDAGLLANVNAAVAAADEASQIEWDYATTVERDSALVTSIMMGLTLTDTEVDDLFKNASVK